MLRLSIPIPIPSRQPFAAPAPGASAQPLNVPYFSQEQMNWCWAACCEMLFEYNGDNVSQCELATNQFGADCCSTPSSSTCNQGQWAELVYAAYRYSCSKSSSAVTYAAACSELDAERPVECYYAW